MSTTLWCETHGSNAAHPNTVCWKRATFQAHLLSDWPDAIMRESLKKGDTDCRLVERVLLPANAPDEDTPPVYARTRPTPRVERRKR